MEKIKEGKMIFKGSDLALLRNILYSTYSYIGGRTDEHEFREEIISDIHTHFLNEHEDSELTFEEQERSKNKDRI